MEPYEIGREPPPASPRCPTPHRLRLSRARTPGSTPTLVDLAVATKGKVNYGCDGAVASGQRG